MSSREQGDMMCFPGMMHRSPAPERRQAIDKGAEMQETGFG
jgi:hypothetical protein